MTLAPPPLTSPLDFRCTGCGNCCRSLRVAVTALDVARLAQAVARAPLQLVDFLPPSAVDMTGEPDSFIELGSGRHLMVLAHENGACRWLATDDSCSAYAARPRDCRAFPFDFGLPSEPGVRRLALLPLDDCRYESGGAHDEQQLLAADGARWAELAAYQRQVARWNRRAFHRRRLGRSIGTAGEFLEYALSELGAS